MELKINKTEWDLSNLSKSDNNPEFSNKRKILEKETSKFVNKWKNNNDYLKDPNALKEALDEYEAWSSNFGTEFDEIVYFWLRLNQDQNNPKIKAKFNQAEELSKKISNDTSFFTLNISKIPESEQDKFLSSEILGPYNHFLKRLFNESKYVLSEGEEKILNLKSTTSHSFWVKMLSEFLSKEERQVISENNKKETKTFSDLFGLMQSKKKKVRDSAAAALNDILLKHSDSAEAEINALLMDKKINDELRGFDRPDKSRHIGDDIETEVVDTLIKSVTDKFSISRDFYKLKAQLMKQKKLKYHERNISYGSLDKHYSYEESINLVHNVFSKLDPKFSEILKRFVENNQIDVYPRKGKRQGAFCVYFLKKHPTFVMLNHTDKLRDVETIAHEIGHAINNELMKEKQNELNFATSLGTAEVASTFMEDFVNQEIMNDSDENLKLSLMIQKLDNDVSTIIRQTACYNFEKEIHLEFRKKGNLTKEEIGKIFQKHMHSYMGDYVEQSPGSENWWIYWSHIRTYFYVYSYASGLLISKSLQNMVKQDHKNIEKVKNFLATGTSKSPKDTFLEAGIDITKKEFWQSGLKEIETLLHQTIKLAKKLKKI